MQRADQQPAELTHFSNEIFREIFKGSVEGILIVNEKGQILLTNKAACQMFGYEEETLLGLSIEALIPNRFSSKHMDFRKMFRQHPEPRRMGEGRDLAAMRKDGTEFPVEISLSYIADKEVFLAMAFISDISLRKRADEQLAIYASELEKKVQQRTVAIDTINKNLQKEILERKRAEDEARKALVKERELNDLKSKFVYVASHEFRTPLSTILSSASLTAQYKDRGEPEKMDKHLNRIKSSVKHLTSILNDFLSLGKLEEGKVEVLTERFRLSDFLSEISEEMKPSMKENQQIFIECPPTQEVESDPRILRNILFNLLSNAIKYSDEGKKITVKCEQGIKTLSIAVNDEGIGIPEEDMKHIADRFFRASNVSNIQGTGLGLNIVRRYTELLGGSIDFTSIYGKGSIFTVTLPMH